MAKRSQFKMNISERRLRHFSENFKKGKVKELESGVTQINDLCKQYEVSTTSVYRWLKLYGTKGGTKERMIVESLSDTQELLRLKMQVAELERTVGQKQILIDFKDKMIDLAEETYGVDIKKKFLSNRPVHLANEGGKYL